MSSRSKWSQLRITNKTGRSQACSLKTSLTVCNQDHVSILKKYRIKSIFLACCLFKYVFILAFPHSTFFFDFNLFLIHQFVYQAYFVFGVAGFQTYDRELCLIVSCLMLFFNIIGNYPFSKCNAFLTLVQTVFVWLKYFDFNITITKEILIILGGFAN